MKIRVFCLAPEISLFLLAFFIPVTVCASLDTIMTPLDNAPLNTTHYRPLQPPLDVEKYPVAPPDLALQQVHVYVRHGECSIRPRNYFLIHLGERTPVGVRLADAPASIPQYWQMCTNARRYQAPVVGASQEQLLSTRKLIEREDGTSLDGECLLGELTDVGRRVGN